MKKLALILAMVAGAVGLAACEQTDAQKAFLEFKAQCAKTPQAKECVDYANGTRA